LKLKPGQVPALVSRALAYHRLHRTDEAIADLNEAARLEPQSAMVYYERGRLFNDRGSYKAALADFLRALQIEPAEARFWNQLAWVLATCPREEFRDGLRAVQHATRACELTDWKDGNILDTLASAYAECGRFAEAVDWARKAVELVGDDIRGEVQRHLQLY